MVFGAAAWLAAPALTAAEGPRRPHVVLIVADDLGYNDITLNGGGVAGDAVPTPNINSIARNGIDFSGGYAGNATCSPRSIGPTRGKSRSRAERSTA